MSPTSWIARLVRFAQSLRADYWSQPGGAGRRWALAPHLRPDELSVRRLEPRRVLTASIQALSVPAEAVEGDAVEVSAEATGVGPLIFDWTITRDSTVIAEGTDQSFSFQPTDDGEYVVSLSVTDASDESVDHAEGTITVVNARPELSQLAATPIVENGVTTLTGVLTDPGGEDAHQLIINWGDPKDPANEQTIDLSDPPPGVTYNAETGEFSVEHRYLDNDAPGANPNVFRINVKATDDDGGEFFGLTAGLVSNAPPELSGLAADDINENGVTLLTGVLTDPGTLDTHTLVIDWGDPLSPGDSQTIDLTDPPPGVSYNAETGEFAIEHQYLDDNPFVTPVDLYTVKVTAIDDDGATAHAETTVQVSNVEPHVVELSATDIQENGFTTLTGRVVDPGAQDVHRLVITWGDPSSPGHLQPVNLSAPPPGVTYNAETGAFSITHQYLDDNPTGTNADTYDIRVNVLDDDGGFSFATTTVKVSNVAPELAEITANDIDEDGLATLTGRIVDAGSLDTFTLTVNWDDGVIEEFTTDPAGSGVSLLDPPDGVTYNAETREFSLTHHYLDDDPTGTPSDPYTIRLTLVDDDADMAVDATTIQVANVPPAIDPVAAVQANEGQPLFIGPGAQPGGVALPGVTFLDVGTLDTHQAVVDWGDGSATEQLVILQNVGSEVRTGVLVGSHTFADNGEYTVTITVTDDDAGQDVRTFVVSVLNVDPGLTGVDGHEVHEGQSVTLAGLGIGLTDPGFDNPYNSGDPANGGETAETFVGMHVDWGDGSSPTPLSVVDRVSGSPGVATTAGFEHDAHYYADDGVYTVTVAMSDDDGQVVHRTFQITVNNVAPTLVLTEEMFVINEGDVLFVPNLGAFTDPGAANPLNPNGPSEETFHYSINWGDGSDDSLNLPVSFVDGGAGVGTSGELVSVEDSHSHTYADNDIDNRYTITVTLYDDDGGADVQSFEITVNNVNPKIEPLSPGELIDDEYMPGILVDAKNLEGEGITLLAMRFSDPGADTYDVWIDWGDKLGLPAGDQRFVKATPINNGFDAEGGVTLVFAYEYDGPPDPRNPAAPITITAVVVDDDYATANGDALIVSAEANFLVEPGRSDPGVAMITNAGIDETNVAIDTTPDIELLEFPPLEESVEPPPVQATVDLAQQSQYAPSSSGEQAAASERVWVIRAVSPDGDFGTPVLLSPDVMDRLPELFGRLPDGHYQILVMQTESDTSRLVMDFVIRGGRPIDLTDDSDGARDRPPTEGQPTAPQPLENREQPEGAVDPIDRTSGRQTLAPQVGVLADAVLADVVLADGVAQRGESTAVAALALGPLALDLSRPRGEWRRRVEQTLAEASDDDWRLLGLLRRRPR